ncbi:IS66 family insertion sequence element accessory protein TnpB [Colwellia psychrerythraea]|uniref:IS66 family insertion sequence element accessory protein TnpB n=1 Tax=Colwellia psychrerythraea TaxID=28229 RepID=UPI0009E05BBB
MTTTEASPFSNVYLHRGPIVFCSKQRNKLKLLYWDKTDFCLWYKRLEKDKFKWPKNMIWLRNIDGEQLHYLLRGVDISAINPHKTSSSTRIFRRFCYISP